MHARVRLLRTGFQQIVELFVAPDQFLNRKHDLFSRTRPRSLLQRQNCVRAVPHQSSATAARETALAAKPAASVAPAAARVTIAALEYSPERIQIRKGDTIEWDNNDLTPHTVTSENGSELDSGSIEADASWSRPHHCKRFIPLSL